MAEVKLKYASDAQANMLTLDKILYTEEEVGDWMQDAELDARARAVQPKHEAPQGEEEEEEEEEEEQEEEAPHMTSPHLTEEAGRAERGLTARERGRRAEVEGFIESICDNKVQQFAAGGSDGEEEEDEKEEELDSVQRMVQQMMRDIKRADLGKLRRFVARETTLQETTLRWQQRVAVAQTRVEEELAATEILVAEMIAAGGGGMRTTTRTHNGRARLPSGWKPMLVHHRRADSARGGHTVVCACTLGPIAVCRPFFNVG